VRLCDECTLNLHWWSYSKYLEPLVPTMWQPFHRQEDRTIQGVVLLRYQVGGHFVRHRDAPTAPTHFGTILLFPPATWCHPEGFEGGDLLLFEKGTDGAEITLTLQPSTFTAWTEVALPLSMEHAVTPVTRGTRYVFKAGLHVARRLLEVGRSDGTDVPWTPPTAAKLAEAVAEERARTAARLAELAEAQDKLRAELAELEARAAKEEAVLAETGGRETFPAITELVDKVQDLARADAVSVWLLLERKYEDGVQPSELVGQDCLLFSQLKAIYPRTTVHTRTFSFHYDEMRESEMDRGISWGDEPEVLLETGIKPRLEVIKVWDFADKEVEDSWCFEYRRADTRFLRQKDSVVPTCGERDVDPGYTDCSYIPSVRATCTALRIYLR